MSWEYHESLIFNGALWMWRGIFPQLQCSIELEIGPWKAQPLADPEWPKIRRSLKRYAFRYAHQHMAPDVVSTARVISAPRQPHGITSIWRPPQEEGTYE